MTFLFLNLTYYTFRDNNIHDMMFTAMSYHMEVFTWNGYCWTVMELSAAADVFSFPSRGRCHITHWTNQRIACLKHQPSSDSEVTKYACWPRCASSPYTHILARPLAANGSCLIFKSWLTFWVVYELLSRGLSECTDCLLMLFV